MNIAVIGAGAIGSLVAGYLKKSGQDVVLIGRERQVKAINENGLAIKSSQGDEVIPLKVLTRLDQKYDLIIFSVKTQDVDQAYQDNAEFLENNQWVLTTQNGVQADNMFSTHFELDHIVSSIVMFGATYVNPGEVTFNFPGDWIIGKPFSPNDAKVQELKEILERAFSVVVTSEISGMKWLKLFVNFNNCIPALIGRSMQETFADMDFCRLSIMLLKEGVDIVQRAGINLVSMPSFPAEKMLGLANMPIDKAAGIINKTLTSLSEEPLYGSILQSILRNKESEIDFINGEVDLLSKGVGKSAPLNRKVVDMVHRVEREGKFFEPEEVKKEFDLI